MLIDASQSEETRVVVLHGNRLEEFDYDSEAKKQLKGNIYLAKITRVEPSLQAAFVEYGGNRHGFLAFNEIHPDYYKIPVADRQQLLAEEAALDESEDAEEGEHVETVGGDEFDDAERRRRRMRRNYKIQEVTKRGQVMLVQVVKEERGNKGAALTTYLSLPGRYCVLMPNTGRGGGISRKISNARDRKRLKSIVDDLGIPDGMAVIVRTAGSERTKAELKRDFEYLIRLWDQIRNDTLQSTAPSLIYEEANLIKRAIRDMYTKDIEDILVDGDEGYRTGKDFMRTLMPSHAKRVQPYKNDGVPLFQRYQVEAQIDAIHSPEVKLRSGGYIVMHQTEALVAIDVNSGRATRERHIEETALKTNLEAAEEVARQLRLRDLAGLIVIDFIDMEEMRNNHTVERRLKDALKSDRARIQVGRISHFGLLEMSRQRMRPSLMEISSEVCHYCGGSGFLQSVEWTGLHVLRAIEEEALRRRAAEISVTMPSKAALYLLNHKRAKVHDLEVRYEMKILITADSDLVAPNYKLDVTRMKAGELPPPPPREAAEEGGQDRQGRRKRRPRRRRHGEDEAFVEDRDESFEEAAEAETTVAETPAAAAHEGQPGDGTQPKRRKRGRRGGRRRGRRGRQGEGQSEGMSPETGTPAVYAASGQEPFRDDEDGDVDGNVADEQTQDEFGYRSDRFEPVTEDVEEMDVTAEPADEASAEIDAAPAERRRPRRRRRRSAASANGAGAAHAETDAIEPVVEPMMPEIETHAPPFPELERDESVPVESMERVAAEAAPEERYSAPAEPEPEEKPVAAEETRQAEDYPPARPEPEPEPAITPEQQRQKRSGWWNRSW
jgi:ribonuclease E